MARRVTAQRHDGGARWLLALLILGSVAVLALFIVFGFLYVNVPSGWSPRLGSEHDATGVFPRMWLSSFTTSS